MEIFIRFKKPIKVKPRVVAIVGKASGGGAAGRNLLKRRVRAVLASEAKSRQADIVATVRGRAEKIGFEKIRTAVRDALKNK